MPRKPKETEPDVEKTDQGLVEASKAIQAAVMKFYELAAGLQRERDYYMRVNGRMAIRAQQLNETIQSLLVEAKAEPKPELPSVTVVTSEQIETLIGRLEEPCFEEAEERKENAAN
jgi:hypothetical protein